MVHTDDAFSGLSDTNPDDPRNPEQASFAGGKPNLKQSEAGPGSSVPEMTTESLSEDEGPSVGAGDRRRSSQAPRGGDNRKPSMQEECLDEFDGPEVQSGTVRRRSSQPVAARQLQQGTPSEVMIPVDTKDPSFEGQVPMDMTKQEPMDFHLTGFTQEPMEEVPEVIEVGEVRRLSRSKDEQGPLLQRSPLQGVEEEAPIGAEFAGKKNLKYPESPRSGRKAVQPQMAEILSYDSSTEGEEEIPGRGGTTVPGDNNRPVTETQDEFQNRPNQEILVPDWLIARH
eukprot:sb/3467788/